MAPAPLVPLPDAELLLLRHGIAEPRRADLPEHGRALTPEGRRRTAALLARLLSWELGADRLLSSPLLRARQTAELAVEAGLAPSLELAEALAPEGGALAELAIWLAAVTPGPGRRRGRLCLVGHEPELSALACRLIGAPAGAISLRKAGVVLLRCGAAPEPGGDGLPRTAARLQLLLTPRVLLATP
ncbi:MAG: histidine phosphatase family protein [Synechococcaceae cyanobacterium]|nr:histidine phosphatase family protein [Synechococcaceae cyanobacterium]